MGPDSPHKGNKIIMIWVTSVSMTYKQVKTGLDLEIDV